MGEYRALLLDALGDEPFFAGAEPGVVDVTTFALLHRMRGNTGDVDEILEGDRLRGWFARVEQVCEARGLRLFSKFWID